MVYRVKSFREIDENTIVIDLAHLTMIYDSDELLEDGYPPREEDGYMRLYRMAPIREICPTMGCSSEEFAARCLEESRELNQPVMVTWRDKENGKGTLDWFCPVATSEGGVFVRDSESRIIDSVKAFALAFNREHRGAWEYLLKNGDWYFYKENSSVRNDLGHQELITKLVAMYSQIGVVAPFLYRKEDGTYTPVVMNKESGKGVLFTSNSYNEIYMDYKEFETNNRMILLNSEGTKQHLVPDIVHEIVGWKAEPNRDYAVDVEVLSTSANKLSTQRTYRLSIRELIEKYGVLDYGELMLEGMSLYTPKEEKPAKISLARIVNEIDKFWTEKIASSCKINEYGDLEFINGAHFAPTLIITLGRVVENKG
ncbi:MAG: hypothetical protein ACOXZ2_01305 [Sphaerochaetaceae bacterium]|nr:hypothetical protein [Sphaerochaetaceae bacterium]